MRRTAEKYFFSRFHYQISNNLLEYYSVENPEAYSGPGQTSKMKHFAKGINGVRSLTVFAQCSATLFKKIKKKRRHWCFPVGVAKFLITSF